MENTGVIIVALLIIIGGIYFLRGENLENINYDSGRALTQSQLELTQPGQIGPTGHGDYIPRNLVANINYPRQFDKYSVMYDDGNKFHIQNDEKKTFTEDDLRLLTLERSRFNPAFQKQQAW